MANLVPSELLQDELEAVVAAGHYESEKEAVGHAIEVLLVANHGLRTATAVELYRRGKVTLARGAEISGLELESFKERLAEAGVTIPIDEPAEEVKSGAERIHAFRAKT